MKAISYFSSKFCVAFNYIYYIRKKFQIQIMIQCNCEFESKLREVTFHFSQ